MNRLSLHVGRASEKYTSEPVVHVLTYHFSYRSYDMRVIGVRILFFCFRLQNYALKPYPTISCYYSNRGVFGIHVKNNVVKSFVESYTDMRFARENDFTKYTKLKTIGHRPPLQIQCYTLVIANAVPKSIFECRLVTRLPITDLHCNVVTYRRYVSTNNDHYSLLVLY